MMEWNKTAPFAALTLSVALAAAGCMAPATDETGDEPDDAVPAATAASQGEQQTGEANQADCDFVPGLTGFGCDDFWFRRFPGPCAPWSWCGPAPFLRFSDGIGGCPCF
jgi:hypothetical protein